MLLFSSESHAEKGKMMPSEWKMLAAMVPDYEVMQLTTSKATDCKLYLNVNPYVANLNAIVFMSTRNGYENLYLLSLKNGTIIQLTDSKAMDGGHANVSAATNTAFFKEDNTIKSVSLIPPYNESVIYSVDTDYDIVGTIAVSSNGQLLGISVYNSDKNVSVLALIDVNNKTLQKVLKDQGKITHVAFNPEYSNKFLYYIDLNDKDDDGYMVVVDTNGDNKTILNKLGKHVTHSFWFPDGVTAAYVLKEVKSIDSPHEEIVSYNTATDKYVYYILPNYGNHFAINPSQTIFQGDGGPSDRYIYYFAINPINNKLTATKMFWHNSSSSSQLWHPHAIFINDTDLIFNSDADGNGNVYLLRKKVK